MENIRKILIIILITSLITFTQSCNKGKEQSETLPFKVIQFDELIEDCIPLNDSIIISSGKSLFKVTLENEKYKKEHLLAEGLTDLIIAGTYNSRILGLNREEDSYKLLNFYLNDKDANLKVEKEEDFNISTDSDEILGNVNLSGDYLYFTHPSTILYSYNVREKSLKQTKMNNPILKVIGFNEIAYLCMRDEVSTLSTKIIALNSQNGNILWNYALNPNKEELAFISDVDFGVNSDELYLMYRAIPYISGDSRGIFGIKVLDRLSGTEKSNLKHFTHFSFGKYIPGTNLFWDDENFYAEVFKDYELSAISKKNNKCNWTYQAGSPLLYLLSISGNKALLLSENGTVNIINTQTGEIVRSYNLTLDPTEAIVTSNLTRNKGKIVQLTDNISVIYLNLYQYEDNKPKQFSELFFININE